MEKSDRPEGQKYIIGYIRSSLANDCGRSIDHQLDTIKRCHTSMAKNGQQCPLKIMVNIGSTIDRRPGFDELMAFLKTDSVDCIITTDISRLSRDPLQLGEIFYAMEKKILTDRIKQGIAASRSRKNAASNTSQNHHHEQ